MAATQPVEPPEPGRTPAHVERYLRAWREEGGAFPQVLEVLTPDLAALSSFNILYQVGAESFVHVYLHEGMELARYVAVEPNFGMPTGHLEPRVIELIAQQADRLLAGERDATPSERLRAAVSAVCRESPPDPPPPAWRRKREADFVAVTADELTALQYVITRNKLALGPLQVILTDPYIEDVRNNGLGPIYLIHGIFGNMQCAFGFESDSELDAFVIGLGEKMRRSITQRDPIVDATLPDGSRINIVYGRRVSRLGTNFSIRRMSRAPLSVIELLEGGTVSSALLAYLSLITTEGLNYLIAGEAASGKTTLLNALTAFRPPGDRIVTIEDTAELRLQHRNWAAEIAQSGGPEATGTALFELVKASLRQRPDAVIVGEIRGEEARMVFQAMQTGHACASTIHADSVENVIRRLSGFPILVARPDIKNLHVVVILRIVRMPNGRRVRRVVSVQEITGYDSNTDTIDFQEVLSWDPATDVHRFLRSPLLERRVEPRLTSKSDTEATIRVLLEKRKTFLEQLLRGGIGDFDKVHTALAQAYRQGLFH